MCRTKYIQISQKYSIKPDSKDFNRVQNWNTEYFNDVKTLEHKRRSQTLNKNLNEFHLCYIHRDQFLVWYNEI